MGLQIWHITCFHGRLYLLAQGPYFDSHGSRRGAANYRSCEFHGTQPHTLLCPPSVAAFRPRGQSWVARQRLSGPQNLKYLLSTFMGKVCRPPGIQSRCSIHLGNSQTHPQQVWLNCSQCSEGNVMSKGSRAVHKGCRSLGGYEPHSVPLPPSFLCPRLAT